MVPFYKGTVPHPHALITSNCGLNDPFLTYIEIAILPVSVLHGKTFKSYLGKKHSKFMNGLMDFL